ncbi:ADP-ribosylglycohydrolase family protein [soil metagenome]
MPPPSIDPDRIAGALLGTAVGDALGMPVERLSHQNVRTHYKGIKGYTADEKRGHVAAGQWTGDTQRTFALARALTNAGSDKPGAYASELTALDSDGIRWESAPLGVVARLRAGIGPMQAGDIADDSNSGAVSAAPAGCFLAMNESEGDAVENCFRVVILHPLALVASIGQAHAVRLAVTSPAGMLDPDAFLHSVTRITSDLENRLGEPEHRCSRRLEHLAQMRNAYPLDLQDACDGTGSSADQSWPFAVVMFARAPELLEATLLSSINVGGDSNSIGAMVGALLGALHGWSVFPEEWRSGLSDRAPLEDEARAFAESVLSR